MTYTLPLPPSTLNHMYHTRGGQWFKDRRIKDWEEDCLWRLKGKIEKTAGPVSVAIWLYFRDRRRRDIDGLIKPILDLLERAGIYENDALVEYLSVAKSRDAENPRVEVNVYESGGDD